MKAKSFFYALCIAPKDLGCQMYCDLFKEPKKPSLAILKPVVGNVMSSNTVPIVLSSSGPVCVVSHRIVYLHGAEYWQGQEYRSTTDTAIVISRNAVEKYVTMMTFTQPVLEDLWKSTKALMPSLRLIVKGLEGKDARVGVPGTWIDQEFPLSRLTATAGYSAILLSLCLLHDANVMTIQRTPWTYIWMVLWPAKEPRNMVSREAERTVVNASHTAGTGA